MILKKKSWACESARLKKDGQQLATAPQLKLNNHSLITVCPYRYNHGWN